MLLGWVGWVAALGFLPGTAWFVLVAFLWVTWMGILVSELGRLLDLEPNCPRWAGAPSTEVEGEQCQPENPL